MISEILNEMSPKPIQLVVGLEDLKAILSEVVEQAGRKKEIMDRIAETVDTSADTPMEERYLSKAAAMTVLDISKTTLWRWTKMGLLKKYKIGGKAMYKGSDVKKLLQNNGSIII